jgi:hypothetical protein
MPPKNLDCHCTLPTSVFSVTLWQEIVLCGQKKPPQFPGAALEFGD